MSSKGTRFFASLFGIRLSEDAPKITSLVPQKICNEIMSGQLPVFRPSTLLLETNETCHYMDKCALAVKQKEKSYQHRRHGGGYKLTKNYTMYSSSGISRPIEQEWYEFKEGVIFITNKRIIFVEPNYGFEKKIKNISAVVPYDDAISLQFGSQTITLMIDQSIMLANLFQLIH